LTQGSTLTIVKAWILAGKPEAIIPPIASFTEWSRHCRHSLCWLGLPDPASKIFEQMAEDPDAELLGQFIQGWVSAFGHTPAGVRDLCERADFDPKGDISVAINEIALERGNTINRRRLGRWIKRHEGRIIDGRRLVPEKNGGRNASAWRIAIVQDSVTSVISVSPAHSGKVSKPQKDENTIDEVEIC
jgi:hypothetical protein